MKSNDYNSLKGRKSLYWLELAESWICHSQVAPCCLYVPSNQPLLRCGNTCYHLDTRREIIPPVINHRSAAADLLKTSILVRDGNVSPLLAELWQVTRDERERRWSCGWRVPGAPARSEENDSPARSRLQPQRCERSGRPIPTRFSLLAPHLGWCKRTTLLVWGVG